MEASKANRTSKADFGLFVKVAKKWIKILGLTGYRASFEHLEESELEGDKNRAYVRIKAPLVTYTLTKDWVEDEVTRERIINCAVHEVFHVLLDEVIQKGLERDFNLANYQIAEEMLITRLINGLVELRVIKDA